MGRLTSLSNGTFASVVSPQGNIFLPPFCNSIDTAKAPVAACLPSHVTLSFFLAPRSVHPDVSQRENFCRPSPPAGAMSLQFMRALKHRT